MNVERIIKVLFGLAIVAAVVEVGLWIGAIIIAAHFVAKHW